MAMNQLLPLEMEDSSILETSLISLRDNFEATSVASMAATLTSHGSQHDSAELMQILGIRTQIDTTPRRSSLRKRTQAVPSTLPIIQDSTLPLQNDVNQDSNVMTLLEAIPIFNPSQPSIINSITLNHVTQQNFTSESVESNQNDTFSERSGPPRIVQELGATFPNIQPFNQTQISISDLFQIGANETENDSDSVKQKNPILSEAEIKLKLALDEKKKQEKKYLEKMKKLNREVQTLKQSLTCKLCMDKEVSQVLLPCGHVICCNQCVAKIQICPICRGEIVDSKIVYFS